MNVFLTATDLFSEIGGGQTFYRQLILKNKNITFSYLANNKNSETLCPSNAKPIPYEKVFHLPGTPFDAELFLDIPSWARYPVSVAANIANSVKGLQFDIIEIPDWETYGPFLKYLLPQFDIKYHKLVLSMHGNISKSVSLNWDKGQDDYCALEFSEKQHFLCCDIRYAISEFYINEWNKKTGIKAEYFHPYNFFERPPLKPYSDSSQKPGLLFFGRTEKRKGPDLLLNIAWHLNKNFYEKGLIIGPECILQNRTTSTSRLQEIIKHRNLNFEIKNGISQKEMSDYFSRKFLTILPSRYDTFNLVALESIFSGCPVVIGKNSGVVDFLKNEHPEVPFFDLPTDNFLNSLSIVDHVIENYSSIRSKLFTSLEKIPTNHRFHSLNLENIYKSDPKSFKIAEHIFVPIVLKYLKNSQNTQIKTTVQPPKKLSIKQLIKEKIVYLSKHQNYKNTSKLKQAFFKTFGLLPRIARKLKNRNFKKQKYIDICLRYFDIQKYPENESKDLVLKLQSLYVFLKSIDFAKNTLFNQMSKLALIKQKTLIAISYMIRNFRLNQEAPTSELSFVLDELKINNFAQEAYALNLIHNSNANKKFITETLEDRRLKLRTNFHKTEDYEMIHKRKTKNKFKISIIVSLYNAANKLNFFLEMLKRQTLVQTGDAEIILIDSNSPTNEASIYFAFLTNSNFNISYYRTKCKETIQKAWNRGIQISEGDFLTFLGVDEGITPNALEVLLFELENDSKIDWVQGNSLVTNVNQTGLWLEDVMLYDRSNFHPFHIYLETCYISWVGALYRKSIHTRFGYYDESFRAAGDTEFKNRICPFLNLKVIPRTLGIFFNYPEERTTQSPLAELEDIRAWYIFRTDEGLEYIFQNKNQCFVEEAFKLCLSYRKSYCSHKSTDIDMAILVCKYLKKNYPESKYIQLLDSLTELKKSYLLFDNQDLSSYFLIISAKKQLSKAKKNFILSANKIGLDQIDFNYSNDNRYEQHNGYWQIDVV